LKEIKRASNMIEFEIKKNSTIFHKVWQEIYLLFFFNLGLVIGNTLFFTKYYLVIELCVFGLFLYQLFNKRNRQVYKLLLNEKEKNLTVFYYQFIALKFTQNITFDLLQVEYKHKLYGRGKIPKTLELKRNRVLIAEIKQKYNFGWTNEQIDDIYNRLDKIKSV
jgi:hypothetical protein